MEQSGIHPTYSGYAGSNPALQHRVNRESRIQHPFISRLYGIAALKAEAQSGHIQTWS